VVVDGVVAEPVLVLASSSARRRELLTRLDVPFVVRVANLDESPLPGERATDYVRRLALEKASAVARPSEVVIGADTTIELDGLIVGKAADKGQAELILRGLSGRTHFVHTGLAVLAGGHTVSHVETTSVEMAVLDEVTMRWYLETMEWEGKAGAYALQGSGDVLVTAVQGSVTNVIGLPLRALDMLIRTATGSPLVAVAHKTP
jgi:septum formation protein